MNFPSSCNAFSPQCNRADVIADGLPAYRVLKLLVGAEELLNLSLQRCCSCVARGHAGSSAKMILVFTKLGDPLADA